MAPEQAMAKDVGPRTDLYSVGVIAYELMVGRVPFDQTDTPMQILWKHVFDPPPPPLSIDPTLDPRLASWLESMLEKGPATGHREQRRRGSTSKRSSSRFSDIGGGGRHV